MKSRNAKLKKKGEAWHDIQIPQQDLALGMQECLTAHIA